ncbi:hypothetical protein WA016_03606 [Myxococcus stipitatus]
MWNAARRPLSSRVCTVPRRSVGGPPYKEARWRECSPWNRVCGASMAVGPWSLGVAFSWPGVRPRVRVTGMRWFGAVGRGSMWNGVPARAVGAFALVISSSPRMRTWRVRLFGLGTVTVRTSLARARLRHRGEAPLRHSGALDGLCSGFGSNRLSNNDAESTDLSLRTRSSDAAMFWARHHRIHEGCALLLSHDSDWAHDQGHAVSGEARGEDSPRFHTPRDSICLREQGLHGGFVRIRQGISHVLGSEPLHQRNREEDASAFDRVSTATAYGNAQPSSIAPCGTPRASP